MSNELLSNVYVISNVAFKGNSVNTLHASGDHPRKLALFPGTQEKLEVQNVGGGRYIITATGTNAAIIDNAVYGVFHQPPVTERWTLEYHPQYNAYTVNATSQHGAWTLPKGDLHTQVVVHPITAHPTSEEFKKSLFTFTGPGPHAHD
ncbi:hypothetical protein SERLA73DRAFT_142996, partial [Serpula lacrymans var. lacrymans S7.3]